MSDPPYLVFRGHCVVGGRGGRRQEPLPLLHDVGGAADRRRPGGRRGRRDFIIRTGGNVALKERYLTTDPLVHS